MIVLVKPESSPADREALYSFLRRHSAGIEPVFLSEEPVIRVLEPAVPAGRIRELPAVQAVFSTSYQDFSGEGASERVYRISAGGRDWNVGGERLLLFAEPVWSSEQSAEEERLAELLRRLIQSGLNGLGYHRPAPIPGQNGRKPSPADSVCFSVLRVVAESLSLPLMGEILSVGEIELFADHLDLIRIGPQNLGNIPLLRELCRLGKVLVVERDPALRLEYFLPAVEFLFSEGAGDIILGERVGRHPFSAGGPRLDVSLIPESRRWTRLPVFADLSPEQSFFSEYDPAESGLYSRLISSLAMSAAAAGAQGVNLPLLIPERSERKTPFYGVGIDEASYLLEDLGKLGILLGKELPPPPSSLPLGGKSDPESPVVVAFQGEPGAYSEQALLEFFAVSEHSRTLEVSGTPEVLACPNFRAMFRAVLEGRARFAMVPIENSLAGTIAENYDLLLEYLDLKIYGETKLRVSHMLIGNPGSRLSDIRIVKSHPQALAQSAQFLEKYGLRPIANFDTAGSVRELRDRPEKEVAVIAGSFAAEIYRMEILARAIETNPHNYTRFALVGHSSRETELPNSNKMTFCIRLKDSPGSLSFVLRLFHTFKLNLSKLESRPIVGQPWSYRFYLDAIVGEELPDHFYLELSRITEELRVVGRYPENIS